MRETFRSKNKIHSRREFEETKRKGVSARGNLFVLYKLCKSKQGSEPRLGMSVSKAVGSATVRNRIKRRIREIFRKMKAELADSDVFLVVRPSAGTANFIDLSSGLHEIIIIKAR